MFTPIPGYVSKGKGIGFVYSATKVCILKVGGQFFTPLSRYVYLRLEGKGFFYTTTKVYILKVGGQFFTPLQRYKY